MLIVTLLTALHLTVQPVQPNARLYVSYNLQGGKITTSQALGNAPVANRLQGNGGADFIFYAGVQGSQEAGDELQPALGYGALNLVLQ